MDFTEDMSKEGAFVAGAKPKPRRKPVKSKKRPAKSKAKKTTKRKAAKPKKKSAKRPAKSKAIVRSERLDMRLTKAEKTRINAKAKKTRRTVTSLVIEAIEKIR